MKNLTNVLQLYFFMKFFEIVEIYIIVEISLFDRMKKI